MSKATFDGADGKLISLNGEVVVACCENSFAPGTPLTFVVVFEDGAVEFKAKAKGSKRMGDTFEVTMRLVNIRKADRARLVQTLSVSS